MSPTRLVVSTPGDALRDALGEPPEGVELVRWDMSGPSPRRSLDIAVRPYMGPSEETLKWLDDLPVRLVQSQSIGYDGIEQTLPAGHVYANAASVHETSTAELALALILASQRGIPDFVRAASEGVWRPARYPSLADRSVLLVGYGGVGRAIEARLLPFETSVVRVARTARSDERGLIHAFADLADLLPLADIVVIAVPLSLT